MSGYIRQIQSSDGSPITAPTTVVVAANGFATYPDDASFEAAIGRAGQEGDAYFNTTIQSVRYYKNATWQDILADEIFFDNSGTNIVAAVVQGALVELDSDLETLTTDFETHELSDTEHGVDPSGVVAGTVGSIFQTKELAWADDASDVAEIDLVPTKIGTRLTGITAPRALRSIAPTNTKVLILTNTSGFGLTVKNEDAGATAANRIVTGTGSDLTMAAGSSLYMVYDTTGLRYRIIGGSGSGGGGTDPMTTRGDIIYVMPQIPVKGCGLVQTDRSLSLMVQTSVGEMLRVVLDRRTTY